MKKPKKYINITNFNREGQHIWFEETSEKNIFEINTDSEYALKYSRIIFDEINDDETEGDFESNGKKFKILAYDPSGGPYMSVNNFEIKNMTLKRIFLDNKSKKHLFVFKDNDEETA